MIRLTLKVEASAGQSFEEVAFSMCNLARKLNMWVACDVNGIHTLAHPMDEPKTIERAIQVALHRKSSFASANAMPLGPNGEDGYPEGWEVPK